MDARRFATRWDRVNGIVALVVGVLAVLFSGYTAYLQRAQAHSAVWPHVSVGYSDSSGFRVLVGNQGVGPALIRSAELRVDARLVPNWLEALRLVPGVQADPPYTWSTIHHRVLTPGESVDILTVHDAELAGALDRARARFSFTICYCSIFDDCWIQRAGAEDVEPIARCPSPGPKSFLQ
jgi:hypothetical protein